MYERPNPSDEPLPDDETTTSPHGDELEDLISDEDAEAPEEPPTDD
jgi:hypothetical protein